MGDTKKMGEQIDDGAEALFGSGGLPAMDRCSGPQVIMIGSISLQALFVKAGHNNRRGAIPSWVAQLLTHITYCILRTAYCTSNRHAWPCAPEAGRVQLQEGPTLLVPRLAIFPASAEHGAKHGLDQTHRAAVAFASCIATTTATTASGAWHS